MSECLHADSPRTDYFDSQGGIMVAGLVQYGRSNWFNCGWLMDITWNLCVEFMTAMMHCF